MDEQIIFTTNSTGTITNVHSYEQTNLRQCSVGFRNTAVKVGSNYLFVAQAQKALINVYNIKQGTSRESIEQRLPLPEVVNGLEVVNNVNISKECSIERQHHALPEFNLPYLLIASTESGKLYIWELNSGILLNVKAGAHYQSITKIKSILDGKYIITSGNDSRVIIWQTADLVTQEDPKPVLVLHDHTLPVADFEVSSTYGKNLMTSGLRLYTASKDSTVRCYDLSTLVGSGNEKRRMQKNKDVQLLATFSLPYPINCIRLDPAERAIYLGTQTGCFSLSLFYKLNGNKIANLLQLTDDNRGKIYSLIEDSITESTKSNRDALFAKGQIVCDKLLDNNIVCLNISMDGSILLIGDTNGVVYITEIFSKQILKSLQPLSTQHTLHGEVTNILLNTYSTEDSDKLSSNLRTGHGSTKTLEKLPPLQRVIYEKSKLGQTHDIWYQIGETTENNSSSGFVSPLGNFEAFLSNVQGQESSFRELGSVSSDVNVVGGTTTIIAATTDSNNEKQKEIDELKKNVETLTNAYKELREIHEKLYKENEASN